MVFGEYSQGYTGPRSVTIPNSVTSIGEDAFSNTEYYNNESNWKNGALYIGKWLIKVKDTVSGSYVVKKLGIADSAFAGCTALTSVTIPNSVTSIGGYAFYSCDGLTSIKYRGTEEQWNAISKGNNWNYNTGNCTITYNYTGE